MNGIVGFAIFTGLTDSAQIRAKSAIQSALESFPRLQQRSFLVGDAHVLLWGHGDLAESLYSGPDGSTVALVGSPIGGPLNAVVDSLIDGKTSVPSWDGHFVLIRLSDRGRRWTIWNDWFGAIPFYTATVGGGRIASSLEPAVVAAAGFGPNDFSMPGMLCLLMNGHFLGDLTLYKAMQSAPPDTRLVWDASGLTLTRLDTVTVTCDRWETSWDDLVDEMHQVTYQAISQVLGSADRWVLPLSGGLDSRLIAAVGADRRVDWRAYAWGEPQGTDVVCSREIAASLHIPWKHVPLDSGFLDSYTHQWSALFGSALPFHGMYQMSFFDSLSLDGSTPCVSGFLGDVLTGHSWMHRPVNGVIYSDLWNTVWTPEELKSLFLEPIDVALEELISIALDLWPSEPVPDSMRGTLYDLRTRQRRFTSFQVTLASMHSLVGIPFLNREFAQFGLSLPRTARDGRRLIADTFRKHHGKVAVIPGSYGPEPLIPTGRHLLSRRLAQLVPSVFRGSLGRFTHIPLRLEHLCLKERGPSALWPLFPAIAPMRERFHVKSLDSVYRTFETSSDDVRPLRKLQALQPLAYRLLEADSDRASVASVTRTASPVEAVT